MDVRGILPERMTLLPILQRELRIRARNPATFWGRFAVGVVGVLVCIPPLIWSGPYWTPGTIGRGMFNSLVTAAFLLCCAACLLTADTISSERREGTLGLLLLTRVRHFDVLAGKFASTAFTSMAGLIAFLPILALPLLTGGVSGGEALRKALALCNVLFLALSVGLWCSARGSDRFRTTRAALLVLAGLVLGPPFLGRLLPGTRAALASPLGTLLEAADPSYRASADHYWLSLALVQIFGWVFIAGATFSLRKQMGGAELEAEDLARRCPQSSAEHLADASKGGSNVSSATSSRGRCAYCGHQNDEAALFCNDCGTELYPKEPQIEPSANLSSAPTPVHWLLGRQRGMHAMVWAGAVVGFFHTALFATVGRVFGVGMGPFFLGASSAVGLASAAITGALFAWVASRFFVQARRTGELEVLLSTPLGAEQIVSAQWDALKHLVRWPVLVMLLPGLLQGVFVTLAIGHRSDAWPVYYIFFLLLSSANIVLSVGAYCWLGLWLGLGLREQGRVILWTVLLANGLPYLLSLTWSFLYRPMIALVGVSGYGGISWPWLLGNFVPSGLTLLFYWWLMGVARWHLLHDFSATDPLQPSQILSRLWLPITVAVRRARDWPAI